MNIHARLFPLAGGGSIPGSPSSSFSKISLANDDNEFVVVITPPSSIVTDHSSDYIDDENVTSSTNEDDDPTDNTAPRSRPNAFPAPLSTFKTALLNGI